MSSDNVIVLNGKKYKRIARLKRGEKFKYGDTDTVFVVTDSAHGRPALLFTKADDRKDTFSCPHKNNVVELVN